LPRQFLDEPVVLLNDVGQIFDLQDFDQLVPPVQNQQAIHVQWPGEICTTFIDDHLVGEAVVPNCAVLVR
jgi:hypothetical protein